MSLESAKRAVAIICSAYRTPHGVIDDVFMELAAEGLKGFTDEQLQQMIDPRNGLIGTNKFLPTVAEMIEFCVSRAYSSYQAPPPPNSHPALTIKHIPKEEREKVQAQFAELLDDLSHGMDYFQSYLKQVPVGERFTVWDVGYIDFVDAQRNARKAAREAKQTPAR